jgi:hypothetical protein
MLQDAQQHPGLARRRRSRSRPWSGLPDNQPRAVTPRALLEKSSSQVRFASHPGANRLYVRARARGVYLGAR